MTPLRHNLKGIIYIMATRCTLQAPIYSVMPRSCLEFKFENEVV